MLSLYTGNGVTPVIVILFFLSALYSLYRKSKLSINLNFLFIYIFLAYYLLLTVIFTQDLLVMTSKFILFPIFVYYIIPKNINGVIRILSIFKSFIGFTAIFGLYEYMQHFNLMVNFVKIDAVKWIQTMNLNSVYYPSSIFLHYTYFAYVLLLAFILVIVIPYKNRVLNLVYKTLIAISIFLPQSRIVWIAFGVILILSFILNRQGILTYRKLSVIVLILIIVVSLCLYFDVFAFISNYISLRFSSLYRYGLADGSLGQRIGTLRNWENYLDSDTIKAIIGSGFGGVNSYLSTYSFFNGYTTADSTVTSFLIDTGVIGLFIFLLSMFQILVIVVKGKGIFRELALYTIVASSIVSLTIDFWANYVILHIFYVVIICAFIGMRSTKQEK